MRIVICALLLLSTACSTRSTTQSAPSDSPGCSQQYTERLFFGFSTPHGQVTEAQWQKFLREVVTPKFPAGLSVVSAQGQWLGSDGKLVRESSRILEIVHGESESARKAIDEIASVYKKQFQQDAVMILRSSVLACF
jgi:hypothetical protein